MIRTRETAARKALLYKTKSFKGDCNPKGRGKRAASKARRNVGKALCRVGGE
jgi:hypothetical protein